MNKEEIDNFVDLICNPNIQEEIEKGATILQVVKEKQDLQQRINKAIEYIKENCSNYYVDEPHYRGVELLDIEKLLEILGEK